MKMRITFLLPAITLLLFAKTVSQNQNDVKPESSSNEKTVDLSGQQLTSIPESEKERILQCEELILDDNNLTVFPEWIKDAKSLKKISVDNNPYLNFLDFCVKCSSPQITEMSASGCSIKEIPYQLTFCDNLHTLNLSNNIIDEIPFHLSFLKNIQYADFSNNRIKTTGYVVNAWRNLRFLDVTGNKNLELFTLGESLSGLRLEKLMIEFGDSVPVSFAQLNTNELYVKGSLSTVPNESVTQWKINTVSFDPGNERNGTFALASSLVKNPNIKSVAASGFEWNTIPGFISSSAQVTSLDLTGNSISSTRGIEQMKQLEELTLNGNDLSWKQVDELKKELPRCIIYAEDSKCAKDADWAVKPPVKELTPETKELVINPKEEFIITTPSTKIEIPENAFLDEKGKVVTTPVEVKFTEYNDPVSVAFSGIPMQYPDKEGNLGNFSSAGMFEFTASSDGKEVFPNPASPVVATLSSSMPGDYNLYTYNEKTGWNALNNENPVPVSVDEDSGTVALAPDAALLARNFIEAIPDTSNPANRLYVSHDLVNMKVKKTPNENSFYILPEFFNMSENSAALNVDILPDSKSFFDMYKLVYNGKNPQKDFKTLDSLYHIVRDSVNKKGNTSITYANKGFFSFLFKSKRIRIYRTSEKIMWNDFRIIPSPATDDYILSMKLGNTPYSFHVYPEVNSADAKKVQEFNRKFLINAQYIRNLQDGEYNRTLEAYKKQRAVFEVIYESKKKAYSDWVKAKESGSAPLSLNTLPYQRQMIISVFGKTNLDYVKRFEKPGILPDIVTDEEGNKQEYESIYVLDTKNNMTVHYSKKVRKHFDKAHFKTALIAIIDAATIGIVSKKQFKESVKANKIKMKVINIKGFNLDEIRELL